MSKVLAIARYTVLEAIRTRLPWVILTALLLLILGSLFVREVAITETTRIQIGFIAATSRLAMVFILCLHVASSMVREFNDKGTELLLALDLPRAGYYAGKLLGFCVVAIGAALLATLALAWLAPPQPLAAWGLALGCELLLVVALTMFCVMTFAQIMPAVSIVLVFYLLARSIAAIQLLAGSQLFNPNLWTRKVMAWMVDGLGLVLPDLARFTQTAWLVGSAEAHSALAYVIVQTGVYVALLTGAGLFDLYRKNL